MGVKKLKELLKNNLSIMKYIIIFVSLFIFKSVYSQSSFEVKPFYQQTINNNVFSEIYNSFQPSNTSTLSLGIDLSYIKNRDQYQHLFGIGFQMMNLKTDFLYVPSQSLPFSETVEKNSLNLTPSYSFRYRFSEQKKVNKYFGFNIKYSFPVVSDIDFFYFLQVAPELLYMFTVNKSELGIYLSLPSIQILHQLSPFSSNYYFLFAAQAGLSYQF